VRGPGIPAKVKLPPAYRAKSKRMREASDDQSFVAASLAARAAVTTNVAIAQDLYSANAVSRGCQLNLGHATATTRSMCTTPPFANIWRAAESNLRAP
jgi:hypothetical protein